MAIIRRSQIIRKSVEEVFRTIIEVDQFPRWNPTTASARRLTPGEIGEGTQFELEIRGFGKVLQDLREFEQNRRVKLVPKIKFLTGGHRFVLSAHRDGTLLDHELEMTPKGMFRLFAPFMGIIGSKNLRDTADALQKYLERA